MNQVKGSLLKRESPLASTAEQRHILTETAAVPEFGATLERFGWKALEAGRVEILQVNVGKVCNQTCGHCHVDAGPDRRESMARETVDLCIRALEGADIPRVDITGGAPELNPNFRFLVTEARRLQRHVMDRCNLTVLFMKGQEDLGTFLAQNKVEIICSLPYYMERETDRQRGTGVFLRSLEALKLLNGLGYGLPDSDLVLNLVCNPVGAFLPASQKALEADFKRNLARRYGIQFHNLYTITNMPISRFLEFLLQSGNYDAYMQKLANAFNPAAVNGLMCRNMVSVGWDGRLFDCDFNQMLDIEVGYAAPRHIADFDPAALHGRRIMTARHCYGCTAGAGSSCGGATAGE